METSSRVDLVELVVKESCVDYSEEPGDAAGAVGDRRLRKHSHTQHSKVVQAAHESSQHVTTALDIWALVYKVLWEY